MHLRIFKIQQQLHRYTVGVFEKMIIFVRNGRKNTVRHKKNFLNYYQILFNPQTFLLKRTSIELNIELIGYSKRSFVKKVA